MSTRQEQLREAKRRQREREREAGLGVYQVKLPRASLARLKAGMSDARFVTRLCEFLDRELVRVSDYPQLRLLCWSRTAEFLTREDAFALYERNWRHVDVARLTDDERALLDALAAELGNGLINA
jgi:hypothetical protein